jgi:hypothetical protein
LFYHCYKNAVVLVRVIHVCRGTCSSVQCYLQEEIVEIPSYPLIPSRVSRIAGDIAPRTLIRYMVVRAGHEDRSSDYIPYEMMPPEERSRQPFGHFCPGNPSQMKPGKSCHDTGAISISKEFARCWRNFRRHIRAFSSRSHLSIVIWYILECLTNLRSIECVR